MYSLDEEFGDVLDRIGERFTLKWACRLYYGYTVEVYDNETNTTKFLFTNDHNIAKVEKWIDELTEG